MTCINISILAEVIHSNTETSVASLRIMLLLTLLLPCSLSYLVSLASANYLRPLAEWGCIDYEWESAEQRDIAMLTGQYIQGNSVINDVEIYGEEMIFVAVTRRDGVPASLATVCGESGNGGRLLRPYPDWSWACSTDCNCITNAQGMVVSGMLYFNIITHSHSSCQLIYFQLLRSTNATDYGWSTMVIKTGYKSVHLNFSLLMSGLIAWSHAKYSRRTWLKIHRRVRAV